MANMLNNLFIALRQAKKNTTTGKRTPEWLKTLFQLLHDDDTPRPSRSSSGGSVGDAAGSVRPTGPLRAGRHDLFSIGTPRSPRKRSTPLIYFAGQSPKEKLFPDQAANQEIQGTAPQFYYNKVKDVAVKIQNGSMETTNMYEFRAKGRRQYVWPDGTVWDTVGQVGHGTQEDEADEEEGEGDGAEEEDEEQEEEDEDKDEQDEEEEQAEGDEEKGEHDE
jgi:hypothetical protein